jgi:hypothetical protein
LVVDVESAAGRRVPAGCEACEPELEALELPAAEADEVPDPEPSPRAVVSEPVVPDPVSPEPPLPDVEGSGSDGTLTSGVETEPTLTEGTVADGVEEGVGTLVPPGRSRAAGMAVSVGVAASRQTSAASANTVASVALRKTPAVVIRECPRRETVAWPVPGCRGCLGNYCF